MILTAQVLDALSFSRDGDGDFIWGGFRIESLPDGAWQFYAGRDGGHRVQTVEELVALAYSDGLHTGHAKTHESIRNPPGN